MAQARLLRDYLGNFRPARHTAIIFCVPLGC
jgi:hypothetical protein